MQKNVVWKGKEGRECKRNENQKDEELNKEEKKRSGDEGNRLMFCGNLLQEKNIKEIVMNGIGKLKRQSYEEEMKNAEQ